MLNVFIMKTINLYNNVTEEQGKELGRHTYNNSKEKLKL